VNLTGLLTENLASGVQSALVAFVDGTSVATLPLKGSGTIKQVELTYFKGFQGFVKDCTYWHFPLLEEHVKSGSKGNSYVSDDWHAEQTYQGSVVTYDFGQMEGKLPPKFESRDGKFASAQDGQTVYLVADKNSIKLPRGLAGSGTLTSTPSSSTR